MPPPEAAALVEKLALGVGAAHAANIVHRDLKPANVLLASDGTPKVSDFGLAKLTDLGDGLTPAWAVMGTPSYMAPEQAGGRAVDAGPAADVYALGAVLYECLTGRPPFKGASTADTLVQVRTRDAVPVRDLVPGVPRDLETICHKCLEKEPGKRYATAAALAAYLTGRPVAARPVGALGRARRWRARNPGLAAAVGVAVTALVVGSAASTGFGVWALDSARHAGIEAGNARTAATRADTEAGNAKAATALAVAEAERARSANKRSQRLLGVTYASEGVKLADDGLLPLGLLRIVQPLVVAPDSPDAEWAARSQFAAYRRYARRQYSLTLVLNHAQSVLDSAFSSDGRRVMTASGTVVRVWDAASGAPLSPPIAHTAPVSRAAFGSGGRRVMTASGTVVRVWDAASGAPLSPPIAHTAFLAHAAFSPDGRWVVTASGTAVRVWDAETGKPLSPPLQFGGMFKAVAFHPDGKRIVIATASTIMLWSPESGASHTSPVSPLQLKGTVLGLSPDGRRVAVVRMIATLRAGGTAEVWDVESGELLSQPIHHGGLPVSADFSPDGRQVAIISMNSALGDGATRVWDAESGTPLSPPIHGVWAVRAMFSADGRRLITSGLDGTARVWDTVSDPPAFYNGTLSQSPFSSDGHRVATVDGMTTRVWDARSGRPLSAPVRHAHKVISVKCSPRGRRIVTTYAGDTVRVWDADSGEPLTPPLPHAGPTDAVAFGPDDKKVLTFHTRSTVRVWNADSGDPLTPPLPHAEPVISAVFSPDGRWVLTAGRHTAQVWDVATGQPLGRAITPPPNPIRSAVFSADGKRILTTNIDSRARVWDPITGLPLTPPFPHPGTVLNPAVFRPVFSPDGKRVVTSGENRTARVWSSDTGDPLTPLLKHGGGVSATAFSPDSRQIATASHDGTARVWDADSGKPLVPPLRHPGPVSAVAFSPDGKRVLTACGTTAQVWDAESGVALSPPLPHTAQVDWVGFAADGRRVLTACRDKTARVWDVTPDDRPAADLVNLAQLLSASRLDDTGAVISLEAGEVTRRWADLRARYPAEFVATPETTRRWREGEIRDAIRAGDPRAAESHYWHLVGDLVIGTAR
ncbi:WD40 repeat domain-containing serine/threonine-protein kinase [Fimbriiglobus ruber]|nr:protein kinase [Fimbriiglobus ruber]